MAACERADVQEREAGVKFENFCTQAKFGKPVNSRFLGLDKLERWDLSCSSTHGSRVEWKTGRLRTLDDLAKQTIGKSNEPFIRAENVAQVVSPHLAGVVIADGWVVRS